MACGLRPERAILVARMREGGRRFKSSFLDQDGCPFCSAVYKSTYTILLNSIVCTGDWLLSTTGAGG